MLPKIAQRWWVTVILFFGCIVFTTYEEWSRQDELFGDWGFNFLYILCGITGVAAISNWVKLYRRHKNKVVWRFLLIPVSGLSFFIAARAHNYSYRHQPYFIKAGFFQDVSGGELILRRDSTYKFTDLGPFGEGDSYEHRFSMHGDTIIMSEFPVITAAATNRFVIVRERNYKGDLDTAIYQLDNENKAGGFLRLIVHENLTR